MFTKYCVLYKVGGVERRSPWFGSEALADRALTILRRRHGNAVIYAD